MFSIIAIFLDRNGYLHKKSNSVTKGLKLPYSGFTLAVENECLLQNVFVFGVAGDSRLSIANIR